MMYEIMNGLVDVNLAAGLLVPPKPAAQARVHIQQLPHSGTDTYSAFLLPIGNPILELCPCRCSISRVSTCLQKFRSALTGWMEGHASSLLLY